MTPIGITVKAFASQSELAPYELKEAILVHDSDLTVMLADPARQTEVRARLREELESAPKTLSYMRWLKQLPKPEARESVVLVSSFTIEPLAPFLEVQAYLSGWRPDARFIQYGQWRNALLDPEVLDGQSYRAVTVLLLAEEILPQGSSDVAAAVGQLTDLVAAFRGRCTVPLFVGLLDAPPAAHEIALGGLGAQARTTLVADLCAGVAKSLSGIADVHVIDLGLTSLSTEEWYNPVGHLATISPLAPKGLIAVAEQVGRAVACLCRPRRKVLVLDLDNTLWGGIVGEDGVEGVALGTEWPGAAYVAFQRSLRTLRSTGVLLAIASKNNEGDAREVFDVRPEMVLAWNDFSARRIDWNDKASNIASLAEELGLGLDSFVFADDSAMECARVRSALPEVEVVELGPDPSRFAERVLRTRAFDTLSISKEDRARADSYRQEQSRKSSRAKVADLETFLADSQLRLTLRPSDAATQERIFQLIGKTNQFNMTLERLSKPSVQQLTDHGGALYGAQLVDRFGDYGLIGVLHLEPRADGLCIVNMLMSCRALGRQVEEALLAFAREIAEMHGLSRLVATYVRGPRNQQVLEFLSRAGFSTREGNESQVEAWIELNDGVLSWPRHVAVDRPALGKAAE